MSAISYPGAALERSGQFHSSLECTIGDCVLLLVCLCSLIDFKLQIIWSLFFSQHDSHTCGILLYVYISFISGLMFIETPSFRRHPPHLLTCLRACVTYPPLFCRPGSFDTMLEVAVSSGKVIHFPQIIVSLLAYIVLFCLTTFAVFPLSFLQSSPPFLLVPSKCSPSERPVPSENSGYTANISFPWHFPQK